MVMAMYHYRASPPPASSPSLSSRRRSLSQLVIPKRGVFTAFRTIVFLIAFQVLWVQAQDADTNNNTNTNANTNTAPISPCSVCYDGSRVTKPEALLDIPNLGTLPCATVDAIVATLYSTQDSDCKLLQSISTICGCPSLVVLGVDDAGDDDDDDGGPCPLCKNFQEVPDQRADLPLAYLDEVVQYEGVTCRHLNAYLESSIASSNATCQLGQAWTRDYCCGSSSTTDTDTDTAGTGTNWIPPETPCEVCVETPENTIQLGLELSCRQIQQAASTLWEASSENCAQVQSLTRTTCGCGGSSGQAEGTDSCSFCKVESSSGSVTTPERRVSFLADQFLGIAPTCLQVQEATTLLSASSEDCRDLQLVGSYCGCPTVKNACTFCPKPGDAITTPTKRHTSTLVRFGESVTCEQLEAILEQHSTSSLECFLAQETNWECGCNDGHYGYLGTESTRDQTILAWTSRASGLLSLVGALFILQDFFRNGDRSNVYRQLMALMACFDFITAATWITGPFAIPSEDIDGNDSNIYGAVGNDGLCTAQGFFIMLGYGSGLFNNSLSIYYVFVVVYGWKNHQLEKARKWLYGTPILCAFILAFAGIPFFEHVWIGCWIRPEPFSGEHPQAAIWFSVLPICLTSFISTTCQIRVYLSVRSKVRASLKWTMQHRIKHQPQPPPPSYWKRCCSCFYAHQEDDSHYVSSGCCTGAILLQNNAESAVFWQSVSYLIAYYLCWPILVAGVLNADNERFGFWVTLSVLAPLQGFFNCLVYVRPRVMRWRRQCRNAKAKAQKQQQQSTLTETIAGGGAAFNNHHHQQHHQPIEGRDHLWVSGKTNSTSDQVSSSMRWLTGENTKGHAGEGQEKGHVFVHREFQNDGGTNGPMMDHGSHSDQSDRPSKTTTKQEGGNASEDSFESNPKAKDVVETSPISLESDLFSLQFPSLI